VSATGSSAAPRSYTVEAGKRLEDTVPLDTGDIVVTGPGAFHRRFRHDPALAVEARGLHRRGRGGELALTLTNRGTAPVRLAVEATVYPKAPVRHCTLAPASSQTLVWSVKDSAGWYDLSVTADGSDAFLYRLAGRVETGRPSTSDPAMA